MKLNKYLAIASIALMSSNVFSNSSVKDTITKLNWNGIEVVYLEDNRFPTYEMVMYFADGALSDGKNAGETEHAFNLMDSGTTKLTQEQILDQMDFLGTEVDADVTHEYTTLSIAGLSKDLSTAMKETCHLLREGTYPMNVVKKEIDKEKSVYRTIVSNPQGLADRAYRELSLSGSPYSYPVSGKMKDLDLYTSESLKNKMTYFLDNVKKRIYLTGPKSILEVEKILTNDCKLKGNAKDFERQITYKKIENKKAEIVFVPVPDANQVQVRIGRFLNYDEISDRNLDALASDLLGGGFTSKLMREVRVKRGLTYSIGSFIASQKNYGRAGISTFTKNETINSLIKVIEDTLTKVAKNGISTEELERGKSGLMGSHPFKFESNKAFLLQLLYLDHVGLSYDELFNFNQSIAKYSESDVKKKLVQIFDPKKQTIFILGDKKLLPKLKKLPKKYGKLRTVDYNVFI